MREGGGFVLAMIVVFIIGMIVGNDMGDTRSKRIEHKLAFDAGVGRYEADQETGKVEFKYGLTPEKGK